MSNPWFRLYSEMIDDWKIRSISFEDRWHYVALLCLKNEGELDKELSEAQLWKLISIKLGVRGADLEGVKTRLIDAELIDDNWQPLAWDKRQFKSDDSRDRVRKYREKLKKSDGNGHVTLPSRPVNADVTAQESDTDTDTDKETERKARKRAVEVVYPTWLDREAWAGYRELRTKLKKPLTVKAEQINLVELEKLAPGGRGHVEIIEQSIARGWQSFYPLKPAQQQITTARTTVPAEESMHPALVADRERRGLKRFGA
jgi:hypothetical protein